MLDAIAAGESISRGAVRLGLSQPAVSAMLSRVEQHFGARLFTRTAAGVVPTAIGAEVVARARAILFGLDDLTAALVPDPREGRTRKVLRVGAQPSPALNLLAPELGSLLPSAKVWLRVDHGQPRIVSLLESGALDVGIVQEPVGSPLTLPAGVGRHVLIPREPVFVGLSAQDPLATRAEIALGELSANEWIDDPLEEGAWPSYFRRACASAGFQPQVSFWTGDWHLARTLVRSGQAIGLYHPTSRPLDGLALVPLRDAPLAQRISVLWRAGADRAARRLIGALVHVYAELADANPAYARWWTRNADARPVPARP
ncbi:LysR family transcriptional regulator [Amycolatopsis minnesotensis]